MKKILIATAIAFSAFSTVALTGCADTTHNSSEHSHELTIENAWVRASEYSDHEGGMTGVFATISNGSDHDVILTGGSTDIAMMVQTHEVVDGMMQETENGITIPAGGSVTLEPGGLHVMLMNLKKPIVSGDKVNFTFAFDDGSEQAFELTAKVSDGGDEEYHDH
jgi:hypothetical protein